MKRFLFTVLVLILQVLPAGAKTELSELKVNSLVSPLCVETAPEFSWVITSDRDSTFQTACEIILSCNGRKVWSYAEQSSVSTGTVCGVELQPDTRYDWSVRVRDNHGTWSKPAKSFFRTGICGQWKASWIGAEPLEGVLVPTPLYFRTEGKVSRKIKSATAYVTSKGLYEVNINGRKVGDAYLVPGWTSYGKTILYQAWDVTGLLKTGSNGISAVVAPGWWASGINWSGPAKRYRYGRDIALLLQINIEYTDGTKDCIATGKGWEMSRKGPVTDATIYDGESIDPLQDYEWTEAPGAKAPEAAIIPSSSEPVKVRAILKPVKYIITPKGEKVIDFGQNLTGWEKVRIKGPKGRVLRITHAEVLDKDGNFYTENLRSAKATSCFTLSGGDDVFEPTFTFYGFRYIRVEGWDGDLNPDNFEAVAVSSGFADAGTFECSNPTINQLQSNIVWGFRDNFVDVPTDCPQRDERMGWTGDAQVFFRTATFNGNVNRFFRKWLKSLSDDQRPDGSVPRVIPDCFYTDYLPHNAAAGWSDCCTIIPWQHYMAYGDKSVLESQYSSMKAWADFMIRRCDEKHLLNTYKQKFGDWLFHSLSYDPSGSSAVTSKHLIAQCFMAGSLDIVAKSAELLGMEEDAKYYRFKCEEAKKAFCDEYVTPNGLISSDTQTAYVLALHFDMIPEDMRPIATERLVKSIKRYSDHITTGFLGTPYICEVLSSEGRSDKAYTLLLQKTCPSWIYPIEHGATTIWERWNSIQPDGTIIKGMNSFNHYSYGSIGDWLYRWCGGLRETSPAYRTFTVDPHPGGDFKYVKISHKCPYGDISVHWTAEGNRMKTLEVSVPSGTTAEIHCPDGSIRTVGSGHYVYAD